MKRKTFFALTSCLIAMLPYSIPITYAIGPSIVRESKPFGETESSDSDSTYDESDSFNAEPSMQDQPIENSRSGRIFPQRSESVMASNRYGFITRQNSIGSQSPGEEEQTFLQRNMNFRETLQGITPDNLSDPLNLCTDLNEKIKEEYKIKTENGITIERSKESECLKEYAVLNDSIEYGTNFLRNPLVMSGKDSNARPKVNFEWLGITGNNGIFVFKNLDISGNIQITSEANVVFINCNINCTSVRMDGSVEILGGANVEFRNCSLDINQKTNRTTSGIYIRGMGECTRSRNTKVCFNNCKLKGGNLGIYAHQSAIVQVFDCNFSGCSNIALVFKGKNISIVKNCEFTNMEGKPIFVSEESKVKIENCEFTGCKNGAITAIKGSKVKVFGCKFFDLGSTALRFVRSEMNILDCKTEKIAGNCIQIDSSDGQVRSCKFSSNVGFPLVAVIGKGSSPLIEDCCITQLSNFSASSILVREEASPVFKDLFIRAHDETAPIMTCSTLASPTVYQINFEKIRTDNFPEIIVCDASELKIFVPEKTKKHLTEKGEITFSLLNSEGCLKIIKRTGGKVKFLSDDPEVDTLKKWSWEVKQDVNSNKSFDSNEDTEADLIDSMCCKNSNGSDRIRPVLPCGHVLDCCPICGNSDEDVFSFNSEGKLICKDCGPIDFDEIKFRCKICKAPAINGGLHRLYKDSKECSVCLDAYATNFVLPCGHQCLCSRCMKELKLRSQGFLKCPICNQNITRFGIDFLHED